MIAEMFRETKFWLDNFGEGVRVKGVSKSCSYFHQHVCVEKQQFRGWFFFSSPVYC